MKYKIYLNKIKGFSPNTIEIYIRYAKKLKDNDLCYKKLMINLPDYSRNTLRLILSAIISYYKFIQDDRWNEIELPKRDVLVKEFVTHAEYKKIISNINFKTKTGFQKRLIIRLLFETGLRSQELLNITKRDIFGNQIKIKGKGRRERVVKISEWLNDELIFYLKACKTKRLFNFTYRNLHRRVKHLSFPNKKITPHMFRRGYAKYCYEKKISIYDISLSMGHSSIETTASYIKRESEDVDIYKIF